MLAPKVKLKLRKSNIWHTKPTGTTTVWNVYFCLPQTQGHTHTLENTHTTNGEAQYCFLGQMTLLSIVLRSNARNHKSGFSFRS